MQWGPNPNAFGGVATGGTKAKEKAQVAGISNLIGCVSVNRATATHDERSEIRVLNWKSQSGRTTPHRDMATLTSWNDRRGILKGRTSKLFCLNKVGEVDESKPLKDTCDLTAVSQVGETKGVYNITRQTDRVGTLRSCRKITMSPLSPRVFSTRGRDCSRRSEGGTIPNWTGKKTKHSSDA